MSLETDRAAVVKELATARRNRAILAECVFGVGLYFVLLPDLAAGTLGADSVIFLVVFVVAFYRFVGSEAREEDVEFPGSSRRCSSKAGSKEKLQFLLLFDVNSALDLIRPNVKVPLDALRRSSVKSSVDIPSSRN